MENFTDESGITREDIARLSTQEEPKSALTVDDYADALRMQIDVRRAELRRIRASRSTMTGRIIRLIRWAATPKRNKPASIPGIGLELGLIGFHVMIGVGHLILVIRG